MFIGPLRSPSAAPRRYIGVSLGGGRGKTTAIARLEWREDGRPVVLVEARVKVGHRGSGDDTLAARQDSVGYFRDEALVQYLRQWPPSDNILAMDVPLTLPACIGCTQRCPGVSKCKVPAVQWMHEMVDFVRPSAASRDRDKPRVSPYAERPTDWVHAYFSGSDAELGQAAMSPQIARAQYLQSLLAQEYRRGQNWLEVPVRTAIARCMGASLEAKTRRGSYEQVWLARREVLMRAIEGLVIEGVWPDLVARNVHVFRALVCAWVAYRWHLCGRPAKPVIVANNPKESAMLRALDPALDWGFWDESAAKTRSDAQI